jgi:S1-C subfamily serine protease/regulation of enolase protein 1 (concanavalin A-like superfamily)
VSRVGSAGAEIATAVGNESPAETVRRIKDATVFLKVQAVPVQGSGSGFVIRADNDTLLIVTNHHVINPHMKRDADADDARLAQVRPVVTAVFRSGGGSALEQSVPATVVASDREGKRDLALLRVRGVKNPPRPIDLADSPEPTETMPVLIYGFPFGNIDRMLDRSARGNPAITINKGAVSSLRRDTFGRVTYVQIDGSLNPGNSGGPVVDERGRLVGVAVAQISNTTIGFAIPPGELRRMLDGRVGRLRLAFRSQGAGTAELQVEARVIDPFEKVRGVELLYVPAVGNAPAPAPGGDGAWAPLAGATRVNLAVNGGVASAVFQAPVAAGRRLLVQSSSKDAAGQAVYSAPEPYVVPARPTSLTALGAEPSLATGEALKPSFPALGPLIDPVKNCKEVRDDDSLTINLPPGVHLMSDELGVKNAPRALTPVENTFLAQVKVAGFMTPGNQPARLKGRELPFTYQGAGLVLWQDQNNYLRIERAVRGRKGRIVVSNEVLVEVCKNGKPAGTFNATVQDGPMYVRVARVNGALLCMFSTNGRQWVSLKRLAFPFPDKVQVGLTASNASKEPLAARFEEFVLLTEKAKVDGENLR